MKLTLLFSMLCCAISLYSQSGNSEPFSLQDIQQMTQIQLENSIELHRSTLQKLDSIQNVHYDTSSQLWITEHTTRFEYYPNGTLKTQTNETFESFKEIMAFSADGEIMGLRDQIWRGSNFEDSINTVYIYSSNGFHLRDSIYEYSNGNWQITGFAEYQNDSQGNVRVKKYYQLQGATAIPSSKIVYNHDPMGNLVDLSTSQYNNGSWENQYRYFYGYNIDNRITVFYYQFWNGPNFENEYRLENTYISNNNMEGESFFWNGATWVLNGKEESQFDTLVSTQSLFLPEQLKLNGNKIIASQSYFYDNGLWEPKDSTFYFYSDVNPNGIEPSPSPSYYQLVQNPVKEHLQIKNTKSKNSSIFIYSSTGRLIKTAQSNEVLIQMGVQSLANGIYFVAIQNEEEEYEVLRISIHN